MKISYAQNAEDIVLARLLTQDRGFYIDVGAGDPELHSVTKLFYDRGWDGINIEPQPDLYERLKKARPRDRNFAFAIGTQASFVELYVYPNHWGWATISEPVKRQHSEEQITHQVVDVEVRTLNSILNVIRPQHIDFLKIDVEGSEFDVIRSIDLDSWRPRVIVIENILPGQQKRVRKEWHAHLRQRGFIKALFDGLNSFYVQRQDSEAQAILSAPANDFDEYVHNRWVKLMKSGPRQMIQAGVAPVEEPILNSKNAHS